MDEAVAVTRFDGEHHLREMEGRARSGLIRTPLRAGQARGGGQRRAYLGRVKPRKIFVEHVPLDQEVQQVSPAHKLEDLRSIECQPPIAS